VQSHALSESDVISFIYEVRQTKKKNKSQQFLLVSTMSCVMYVFNYCTCEKTYRFDLSWYREQQNEADNVTNICFNMQPYSDFDINCNSLVYVMDKYGACLVNL